VWTAPSCTPTGVTPTVTIVATNAFGLSASRPASFAALPVCSAPSEQVWKLNEAWYTVSPSVACGGCANNNPAVGSCTAGQSVYTSVGIRNCYYFPNNTFPGEWYTAGEFWSPECNTSIGPVYCHAAVRAPCGGDRGESNRDCQ
jgi:hypothetical protein